MKVTQIDNYLELWDSNKLETLWEYLNSLSQTDLAFSVAWMTAMIRDDGEIRLSQWLVWLETKSNNQ
tara:strand:+ start:2258 stop:2458 length:201 start_codon:yes stop_codon:yes gene_type:complete